MTSALEEFVPDWIWLYEYPIRYMGIHVNARMTVIRLKTGGVLLHSPGPLDQALATAVSRIGPVRGIIAPSNFHHLYVPGCQELFPEAATFTCPGVEKKNPNLRFDEMLGDDAPALWADELSQVRIEGSRLITEFAFFHRASRTLILVDVLENIGDDTPDTNWMLRGWFTLFRMWNRAAPAPEYTFTWKDKAAARRSFEQVLSWDFRRVVLAHGELITEHAREVVQRGWRAILTS